MTQTTDYILPVDWSGDRNRHGMTITRELPSSTYTADQPTVIKNGAAQRYDTDNGTANYRVSRGNIWGAHSPLTLYHPTYIPVDINGQKWEIQPNVTVALSAAVVSALQSSGFTVTSV